MDSTAVPPAALPVVSRQARPLRMEALVDGLNRKVTADVLAATFRPALAAYENMGVHDRLTINEERKSAEEIADWYASIFRKKSGWDSMD